MAEFNEDYYEETDSNEFGFYQYYQVCGDTHKMYPVCCQCKCLVAPNRGQGAMCSTCDYEAYRESEMDYEDGFF